MFGCQFGAVSKHVSSLGLAACFEAPSEAYAPSAFAGAAGCDGHSTLAIETTIRPIAAQSCQWSISFKAQAPLNTPKMGIIMTLKVEATGGKTRAK